MSAPTEIHPELLPAGERHIIDWTTGEDFAVEPDAVIRHAREVVPDTAERRATGHLTDAANELLDGLGAVETSFYDDNGRFAGVHYSANIILGSHPGEGGFAIGRPMTLTFTQLAGKDGEIDENGIRYYNLRPKDDEPNVKGQLLSWAVEAHGKELSPIYSTVEYSRQDEDGAWGGVSLPTARRIKDITGQLRESVEASDENLADLAEARQGERPAVGRVALRLVREMSGDVPAVVPSQPDVPIRPDERRAA